MLVWTWGTWPDVLVDFGGELYVPWRLSEGDVLYRDVAYFTGPLSPYVNAAWFRVFGASLLALVLLNLSVLAGIAALLFRLLVRLAGGFAAAGAVVVFLSLFAFAQLEVVGNSNYVCPYSHEVTHGAFLALAALFALERWLETRRTAWAAAIGLACGLAFLTKVEVFLAIAAASLVGLALGFRSGRLGFPRFAAAFLVAAAAPVVVAVAALATAMPAADALRGTLGAWPYTLDGTVADLPFYRWVLGTDHPSENAAKLAAWAGRWLALFGPAAALALLVRARSRRSLLLFVAGVAAGTFLLLALRPTPDTWIEAGRPFPLLAGLLLLPPLRTAWSARSSASDRSRAALAAAFGVYALLLLAKIVLHARVNMYGFALAMPAAMLVLAALLGWVPGWIEGAGGSGALFRGFAAAVAGVAVLAHIAIMHTFVARKTVVVGEGKDAFRADARGTLVNAAVGAVRARIGAGGTLLAMPEGVMINWLARVRAPARYINYMPPEVIMFGEERMLSDFRRNPPDLVALVHKSTAEYGLPWFGADYGAGLMAFVREGYAPGVLFGAEPFRVGTAFGIRLLERRR